MSTIKKGDKVRCISNEGWILFDAEKRPEVGHEYKVSSTEGNYIILEGFDQQDMWHVRNFEKHQTITQLLAETFFGSIVEERPEYERVFTLLAKF